MPHIFKYIIVILIVDDQYDVKEDTINENSLNISYNCTLDDIIPISMLYRGPNTKEKSNNHGSIKEEI